jgi:hypothetical protein
MIPKDLPVIWSALAPMLQITCGSRRKAQNGNHARWLHPEAAISTA